MRLHYPEHRVCGAWRSPLSRQRPRVSSVSQAWQAPPPAWVGLQRQLISGLACVLSGQVGLCSGPSCPRRGAHPPSLPPRHCEVSALQNKSCSLRACPLPLLSAARFRPL